MTHTDEHKQNGSTKISSSQSFDPETIPPVASKTKSVAAELNAKITAKQNSRLKQQAIGTKISKHMEPPKIKTQVPSPQKTSMSPNLLQVSFIDKPPIIKNSYHNFHDVESRLTASKISISDFKTKASTAPVALNLKRNYL